MKKKLIFNFKSIHIKKSSFYLIIYYYFKKIFFCFSQVSKNKTDEIDGMEFMMYCIFGRNKTKQQ